MRKFKTVEEIEQERLEELGLFLFKMPVHKTVVIYARQSTKGQAVKNRESALQQTKEQLARATEFGWSEEKRVLLIENQAKDGTVRSASGRLRIDEREGLSTAVFYIENDEAGALMTRDVARLFRDEDLVGPVVFARACKKHNVLVITDDYTYNFNDKKRGRSDYKKFLEEAQAAADFLEKHVRNVMLKNRDRKGQRGEYVGCTVPVGFMLDEERTFYVPNPYHQDAVKNLFKRFRVLGGNVTILRREILGEPIFQDLPPDILANIGKISLARVPGGWTIKSRSSFIYILTNPAYIGHMYYKGQIVKKNAHTAIVDEEDFWYAYYRLADVDFEGNRIERPNTMTKRYHQRKSEPVPALFSGLRSDGTPIITTNKSTRASVYALNDKGRFHYDIQDRSQMNTTHTRIATKRIDTIFSERLHYRVGETLKAREYQLTQQKASELERRRDAIHQNLLRKMEEVEQEENQLRPDPLKALRASIDETKRKIAEKERISDEATDAMSGEDLRKHFASLKNLRLKLADMQNKLSRSEAQERDQEKVMKKLPEVYTRWSSFSLAEQQRFIRLATSRIILDEIVTGWFKLTIEWSPVLGGNLIDEAHIWSQSGTNSPWTEEEERIVAENYVTGSHQWLMEKLPERSWRAIIIKGIQYGSRKWIQNDSKIKSEKISLNEWKYIHENALPLEEVLAKRIYWKEYLDLVLIENRDDQRTLIARHAIPTCSTGTDV